jgi:tRNA (cytidine/uridine-2'-O-)-methyltransferase
MLEAVTTPMFHVVLHEPEIPNNTGNIGRTCVATGCALHLVHPLAFEVSEKACRRAGLDYWPRLDVSEHDSWQAFLDWHEGVGGGSTAEAQGGTRQPTLWLFTTNSRKAHWEADIRPGDRLVFGKETGGLPADILALEGGGNALSLPMAPGERSLNLAAAACAAIYEGMRQCAQRGDPIPARVGSSRAK